MKNNFLRFLNFSIIAVLVLKISNWFFNYTPEVNEIISKTMFTLIGIVYIIFGFSLANKKSKVIVSLCGLGLIATNFFANYTIMEFIAIIFLIVPMVIGRFIKEENKKSV